MIQMNTGILKNNYFAVNFGRNDSILFWKVGFVRCAIHIVSYVRKHTSSRRTAYEDIMRI